MYRLHYAPDNASLIVRLALEELGVEYQTVLVDRNLQAQKSAAYRALNPFALIPVLETPDGPMFETAAILLWLADRHGAMAPAPQAGERAVFLSWLFATSNGLHTDLRQLFYPALYAGDHPPAHRALCIARIRAHLDRYESLAAAGHSWFNGAAPSVLDYYLAVARRWLVLYPRGNPGGIDPAHWPRLHAMSRRLEARPAVQTAIRAEGLGPAPFSSPVNAAPPEGSAV